MCNEIAERAQQIRGRKRLGTVSKEELAEFPAEQTEFYLDMGQERKIHLYRIAPAEIGQKMPLVINFHGGGFVRERNERDQLFCSRLAMTFQCLVWDVDYSLAPEHPFPAAHEEGCFVVSYALNHAIELGVDPEKILLIGHSAGGNLAATVCMKASEENLARPAALVMEYSSLDLYTDPARKQRVENGMPIEVARAYNAFYCQPEAARNPYVSPVFAEEKQLAGFPDTLVISCGQDSLCCENEEFAMKLVKAGVTVTSRCFKNSRHGFVINRMDEWQSGLALMMRFIQEHM